MEIEELRNLLDYDKESGLFTWKVAFSNGLKVGDIAGSVTDRGYINITIKGKRYFAHRLAWLFAHGLWPSNEIDHINRNRSDNRICNLQEATRKQNSENLSRRKDNTSGYRGVCCNKELGKWRAEIAHNRKRIHLGCFSNIEDAHAAYVNAASIYHTNNQEKLHD